ncbi:MAG: M23 family metallopeptidase [Acidobacteriota bacterium]|nr:M23 family metallopeptidase [Acidobacteriota bacterium]
MLRPERKQSARLVLFGALWGFLAGVLSVAAIVWKAESEQTWLGRGARYVATRLPGVDRWDEGTVDADSPVLESPVATAGTKDGPAPTPSISAPPGAELEARDLTIPVQGIKPEQLVRTFTDARGSSRKHEAIDILAPTGTPVLAVEDGRIARLFNSKAGGLTVYQLDPTERFCYYYAHLDRYADGIRENDTVRRGQVIGYVGVSGNAPKDTPHLHFAIFRLTEAKRWWEGTPVDPYEVLR